MFLDFCVISCHILFHIKVVLLSFLPKSDLKYLFLDLRIENVTSCIKFFNSLCINCFWVLFLQAYYLTTSCHSDVITTSFCKSQPRCSYVSNESPNDVSVELCQDVSVVRLHDILLEHYGNVSRGCYNGVPSVRLLDVSSKSQMKHPTTSQWYVVKTSQWYVSLLSHYYVSATSSLSTKWNIQ